MSSVLIDFFDFCCLQFNFHSFPIVSTVIKLLAMQRVRWTPPPEDALFAAGHSKGSGDVKHFLDDPIEWKDLRMPVRV